MSSTVRTVESATDVPRRRKILFSAFLIVSAGTILELGATWYLKRFEGYDGTHLLQYEFDPYKNIHLTPNYVNTFAIHHNGQGFRKEGTQRRALAGVEPCVSWLLPVGVLKP